LGRDPGARLPGKHLSLEGLVIPSPTAASRAWRIADGQALRHHGWDGEFVVYNDVSGDTHLIDAAAMSLLLALQAHPGATPEALDASPALLADLHGLALVDFAAC